MQLKPRNYVARAQQSGAGRHGARKQLEERKMRAYEAEALRNNELHSQFFGMPNVPVKEIREKLDPVLQMHAVREITKIYIGEHDDEE
jgi:hypothetical protein